MPDKVKPIPEGFHTITSYFLVNDGKKFIKFIKEAFDAVMQYKSLMPDGSIMHAQLKIGDSIIMMGESGGKWNPRPSTIYMYVPDVDSVWTKAINAGGKILREPTDEFYGDRVGGVEDPEGNQWWIATHTTDVSPEEMKKRDNK